MKNKLKLFILPLLFVLGSCTYGSYRMVNGTKTFNNSEISASYKKFSGHVARKFKVKEQGDVFTFTFTCSSLDDNEGKLSIEVNGDNSQKFNGLEMLTEGNNTFNFKLTFVGEYEVKIIGKDHSGSFKLTWVSE